MRTVAWVLSLFLLAIALFPMLDAFGQKKFDLSVDRSEIILCPCRDLSI